MTMNITPTPEEQEQQQEEQLEVETGPIVPTLPQEMLDDEYMTKEVAEMMDRMGREAEEFDALVRQYATPPTEEELRTQEDLEVNEYGNIVTGEDDDDFDSYGRRIVDLDSHPF